MTRQLGRAALAVLLAMVLAGPAAWALDVGDAAPPPAVAKWVSNTPVTLESAKGKVLVVEFWATWCGPCKISIPHLNKLQAKYKDKDVVLVGISDEPEATVTKFMETMPMKYHVAVDDARKTNEAYMKGVDGIPHAFVVGRDGKVVWTGHPMAGMDRVLAQVVAGKFDPAKAKQLSDLREKLQAAGRKRDMPAVMAILDETIKAVPDDPQAYRIKANVLRQQGKGDEAQATLLEMAKACSDDEAVLIEVSDRLATLSELSQRDMAQALALAEDAVKLTGGQSAEALRALARAHYELGHLKLAVETIDKAAKAADGTEAKEVEGEAAFYRSELARRAKDPEAKL